MNDSHIRKVNWPKLQNGFILPKYEIDLDLEALDWIFTYNSFNIGKFGKRTGIMTSS